MTPCQTQVPPPVRRLGLWRLRWRWSLAALGAQLRRWAAFLLVIALVLGPFVTTLIGWPALPFFWAAGQPLASQALVVLGMAVPPVLLCVGLHECLLPSHWREAERALPLRRGQSEGADVPVLLLCQLPWWGLIALSALSWWHASPAWMAGGWAGLGARAGLSILTALLLGLLVLAWQRHGVPWRALGAQRPTRAPPTPTAIAGSHVLRPGWALLGLPLRRGPARPVLHALLWHGGLQALLLAALWTWPRQADWLLAGHALLSMVQLARSHAIAHRCYEPLLEAGVMLPLPASWWHKRLKGLCLLPWAIMQPLWWLSLALGPWVVSARVLPFYVLACVIGPMLSVRGMAGSADARAALWLLPTALWVALCTVLLRA